MDLSKLTSNQIVDKAGNKYKKDKDFQKRVDHALWVTNTWVMGHHIGGMPENDKNAARFGIAVALFIEDNRK